ncbi:MAG: DNA primase [Armatimonadetes bacterium]|nr:DNA primase [Armatimonadota bacterium]
MDRDDAKEEIRARIDLVEFIGQYVRLQRAGSKFRGLCPFHDEKTPSFYVNPELKFWHCFGYGAGGDVFSFVMRQENIDFREALQRLAERTGVRLDRTPQARRQHDQRQAIEHANRIARDHFVANLYQHPAAEHARDYIRSRGFKRTVLKDFQVGFALDSWDDLLRALGKEGVSEAVARAAGLVRPGERGGLYDTFRNRIIFPIVDTTDRVVGFGGRSLDPDNPAKYLNSPETPLFRKGRALYALNLARREISDRNRALIVEGYTDVLSLHQAGIRNVVAGLGTALTAEQLKLLGHYCEEIVFVYDGDAAGAQAALRNLEVLESAGAHVTLVVLPEGMDPDDFITRHGPVEFEKLLESRITPVDYQMRMIFQAHADQGPDGRARAAREAAEVLLKVPDLPQRLEYLARAADLWGQNNPQRTAAMERVLRMEMNRLIRSRGTADDSQRRAAANEGRRDYLTETLISEARGVVTVETELLSLALADERIARRVTQELTPQQMVVPADQVILLALKDQLADGGALDPAALVDALPEEEGVRRRGVELIVTSGNDESEDTRDSEMVKRAIRRLQAHHAAQRGMVARWEPDADRLPADAEDFEQLKRSVMERLDRGELTADDPEYRRYCELMKALRGPGEAGYAQDILRNRPSEESPATAPGGQPATTSAASPGMPSPPPHDEWAEEEGDPFAEEQ